MRWLWLVGVWTIGGCLESGARLPEDGVSGLPDGHSGEVIDGVGPDAPPPAETIEVPDTNVRPDTPNLEPDATPAGCACDFGERCDNACTSPGDVCMRDGVPDGSEVRICRPPAGPGQTCTDHLDGFYLECAPDLLCLVPDPFEEDTPSYCYDCAAQRFEVRGECEAEIGTFWNGFECRTYSGCRCQGPDCERAYPNLDECLRAVGRACSAVVGFQP